MRTASNSLARLIAEAIERAGGAISFAQYMEIALYCPNLGYYERRREIGRNGDFYTSVSVGPLFGDLLAFQFSNWIRETSGLNAPGSSVCVLEAGAHDGRLASDILEALRRGDAALLKRCEYWILEPSAIHRDWQQKTLREFEEQIRWFQNWSEVPAVDGIIFSNELLDAMPVHRVRWNAEQKRWQEWMVGVAGERFGWCLGEPVIDVSCHLPLPTEFGEALPDGFTTEICPAATEWWHCAANKLRQGKLLTIDYGLTAEEFFHPARSMGTLRAFRHHQAGSDLLANPGEQDITASVNFSVLQSAGERAGLKTVEQTSQTRFLTRIAESLWAAHPAQWHGRVTKQFQTLTHPDHLGRAFRVLVQKR